MENNIIQQNKDKKNERLSISLNEERSKIANVKERHYLIEIIIHEDKIEIKSVGMFRK